MTTPGNGAAGHDPTAPADREAHLVELVDDEGRPIGAATVDRAHRLPGRLHRAFSIMLHDSQGRLLLQRRAAVKTRFPMRWANSCCGHPGPGEGLVAAATARLAEELGIDGVALTPVGTFIYRASDPGTGRVEYEYDHVLVGEVPTALEASPDPAEVAQLRWADPDSVDRSLATDPEAYAPWLPGVLSVLRDSSHKTDQG